MEEQRLAAEEDFRKAHEMLMTRLRRQATHLSRSSRIDVSRAPFDHDRHVLARFPNDPLPLFLEATVRERERELWVNFLLDDGFAPVWLDAVDADRIAKGGEPQVRAVPPNRRMDRPSADRLLRVVPEPLDMAYRTVRDADAFEAVPDRGPVAAETALRLPVAQVQQLS